VLNIVSNTNNVKLISIIVLIILIVQFNAIFVILFNVNLINKTIYHLVFAVYFSNRVLKLNKSFHKIILTVISIPLFFHESVFSNWELIIESSLNTYNIYQKNIINNYIFFENNYIINKIYNLTNLNKNTLTSFFEFNTNTSNQLFELTLDTNILKQVITNHTYLNTFRVLILDNSSLIVDSLTFITLTFITYFYLKKKKIIF